MKGTSCHHQYRMTLLVLLLLALSAIACSTPPVDMGRAARDADAVAPIEIVVTRSVDAQVLQPVHAANVTLGDRIHLLGYDFRMTGQALNLALYWQAKERVDESYHVFVHLFDSEGELWGQTDTLPVSGNYPTYAWQPGEVVIDGHTVELTSGALPGTYRAVVGMYDTATNERLPALDSRGQNIPERQIVLDLQVKGRGDSK